MPFDPNTAKPQATKFDPSTAQPNAWKPGDANPFDQFDAPQTSGGVNPFDQFDPKDDGQPMSGPGPTDYGAARNFLTGLLRVPGAIIGAPQAVAHASNWLTTKLGNAITGANLPTSVLDKATIAGQLPTGESVDNAVFGATHVTPYEPTSVGGKVGQAVVTGIGAGLADPLAIAGDIRSGVGAVKALLARGPNALKTGAAAGAANVMTQAGAPPAIAAAAALLTHAGASGVEAAAKGGGGAMLDATKQVFSPAKQGEAEAARTLATVDNTLPGVANPSPADLSTAQAEAKSATDDIGSGLPDWQAGAQLRAGLQGRADALKAARAASADQAYGQFRQQAALPSVDLQPFMRSPSFKKALGAANGAVLDEGHEPLTDYFSLADDDMPAFLTGKAIPTDVLHRVKSQLGDAVSAAAPGSASQRTATMLNNRFGDFLEQQYPARGDFPGYAAVRQNYAEASKPLDVFGHGPVEKALDTDSQFGRSRYTLPDERVPDLFLRSNATRTDLNQLTSAFGGDKDAAMGALEQHLAGVAQAAVRPDGSLDAPAFDRAMAPYQRSMPNMAAWFPKLAGKFSNAKVAQGTLDTMQAQKGIADAVSGGALRDQSGTITGQSFNRWLTANKDALTRTQSPGAVMRLQSMASALRSNPGELADAIKSEIAPAAMGMATGGLEGGVLGTLLHKFTGSAFGTLDAKRQEAFSAAIEKAATDPSYAGRLAATAAKRGQGLSPIRALARAVAATPLAVNAGSD